MALIFLLCFYRHPALKILQSHLASYCSVLLHLPIPSCFLSICSKYLSLPAPDQANCFLTNSPWSLRTIIPFIPAKLFTQFSIVIMPTSFYFLLDETNPHVFYTAGRFCQSCLDSLQHFHVFLEMSCSKCNSSHC